MNQQENTKKRILDLLIICKLSKKDFCEYMGVSSSNFSRSLEKSSFTIDEAAKYEKLGINLRYVMLGKGRIYTNNKNGQKIKHLCNSQGISESNNHVYRLKYWINTHYDSIESFEEKYDIIHEKYFNNKSNDFQIPIELKKILIRVGLNMKWLYDKTECPYNFTDNAKVKRNWLLENCNSDNLIYLEMKGVI